MYRGYSQAQNKATQKYQREHLDQIAIRVKKGDRERYKKYAESIGKPLSVLIVELLEAEIANH